MLEVADIHCRLGHRTILHDISARFAPGLFHVILGPNGSGKSTFLKIFSGDLRPTQGVVRYDGRPLEPGHVPALARVRAVMSQSPDIQFPLPVADIVMMGRYPHFNLTPTARDRAICAEAMEAVSIAGLAARDYQTLSGGEKQRVQFARALSQVWEPAPTGNRFLFLDEPISSLDIRYQHQFLHLAREQASHGLVVIAVLHELNIALQYADTLLFMKAGRLVAHIPTIDVNAALLTAVYDIPVHLIPTPFGPSPLAVYHPPVI